MEAAVPNSSFATLESRYISQILKYLGPNETVLLAATCKDLRQKIRKIMYRESGLNYSETRSQIGKNFFQIMRHNYNKRVLRLSVDEFGLLLADPKSKSLKFQAGFVPFFPGKRVIRTSVGPKAAGFLTDTKSLHLMAVDQLEKLTFKSALVFENVVRFEIYGWVVLEKTDKTLWTTSLQKIGTQKEETWTPLEPVPVLFEDKYAEMVRWTSNFDHIAVVYKNSGITTDKRHTIFVSTAGFLEPISIPYEGEIKALSLGKHKLYLVDKDGHLHNWDFKGNPEHVVQKEIQVKNIFTNGLLSFLMPSINEVKKLEQFTPQEVLEWFQYLRLEKFEDLIGYSKLDGEKISKFTPQDYEKLLGMPYDSPEINQLVMHNRLLRDEYFKNPVIYATGYNGNNELGVNTGNNMITDFQDFTLSLDDYSDDVKEITFGGCATFLKTRKGRKFTCFGYEDAVRKVSADTLGSAAPKEGKNRSRKGSHREEPSSNVRPISVHDSDSDGSEEDNTTAGSKGGKPKRKGGKKKEKLVIAKPDHRVAKKFEKVKWREITEALDSAEALKHQIVDEVISSKNFVYLICHDKIKASHDEVAKDRQIPTGEAVSKILKDPKLKTYTFTVGVRNK